MSFFDLTFRDYTAPTGWRLSRALKALDVSTESFDSVNNAGADGYSHHRTLSINPSPRVWSVPVIAAHELAHILLGHTEFVASLEVNGLSAAMIPHAQFELEAHTVAKAVALGLGLTGTEFSRELVDGYIAAAQQDAPRLTDADAIRLARVVLDILDAGAPMVIDGELEAVG